MTEKQGDNNVVEEQKQQHQLQILQIYDIKTNYCILVTGGSEVLEVTTHQDQQERKRTEENRRPQMTRQRKQQQQLSDDWAYQDLKHDIEADGQRHVVEIM